MRTSTGLLSVHPAGALLITNRSSVLVSETRDVSIFEEQRRLNQPTFESVNVSVNVLFVGWTVCIRRRPGRPLCQRGHIWWRAWGRAWRMACGRWENHLDHSFRPKILGGKGYKENRRWGGCWGEWSFSRTLSIYTSEMADSVINVGLRFWTDSRSKFPARTCNWCPWLRHTWSNFARCFRTRRMGHPPAF